MVRRLVGYGSARGAAALPRRSRLYAASRLFVNFFQPSFKLAEKHRVGARVSKRYYPPETPCARLMASPSIDAGMKERLLAVLATLDPLTTPRRDSHHPEASCRVGTRRGTARPPSSRCRPRPVPAQPRDRLEGRRGSADAPRGAQARAPLANATGSLRGSMAARRHVARDRTRPNGQGTPSATTRRVSCWRSPLVRYERCNEESRNGEGSLPVAFSLRNPLPTVAMTRRCAGPTMRVASRSLGDPPKARRRHKSRGPTGRPTRRSPFLRHPSGRLRADGLATPRSGAARPHAGPRRARPLEGHQDRTICVSERLGVGTRSAEKRFTWPDEIE